MGGFFFIDSLLNLFSRSNIVFRFLLKPGLEENSMEYGLEENVSLITFGGDRARVEQHLTNEFQCLRSKLGD